MTIYTFEDLKSKGILYLELIKSIEDESLIPVIGCGFSSNLNTKHGVVPNVDGLKTFILGILMDQFGYSEDDIAEYKTAKFSELADTFIYELSSVDEKASIAKERFFSYMQNCYCSVTDIPAIKQDFLKCGWPYIYTLNYDDAIEGTLVDYKTIIPFSPLNKKWIKEQRRVIKLHGCAKQLLKSGDLKFCIMSKPQYISAIMAKDNESLYTWLLNDYTSNNLLFIGCGLKDELDLLFASTPLDKLSSDSGQKSYYIYYDESPTQSLKRKQLVDLEQYGIQNIIRITPDQFNDFYGLFNQLFLDANEKKQIDRFQRYRRYNFYIPEASSDENIDFLFREIPMPSKALEKDVMIPAFFISRDECDKLKSDLESGLTIGIIAGNRFSGKTYALIQLFKEFQAEKKSVYLFKDITLSEQIMATVLKKENSIILFDAQVLTPKFLKSIYDLVPKLNERNIKVVCAINRSDRSFLRKFEDRAVIDVRAIKFYNVPTRLSDRELTQFNNGIKSLSLEKRTAKETFLDYALKIEDSSLKNYGKTLPDVNFISRQAPEILECMIVLSAYPFIENEEANYLEIRDALSELCTHYSKAIEKDFLSAWEKNLDTHSGMKFICNSSYWVFRSLSSFASLKGNYKLIAEAIKNIVFRYMKKFTHYDGTVDFNVYQKIMPYYFLENLQKVFFCDSPNKGSLELPELIYNELKGILGDEYQFLHQTAKCKLRFARRRKDNSNFLLETLNSANHIILRAQQLAQEHNGKNIEYTLAHMEVTKALIITNFLRYCTVEKEKSEDYLVKTIKSYYIIFVEQNLFLSEVSNEFDDNELDDVQWYFDQFMMPQGKFKTILTNNESRKMVESILTKRIGKAIKINWN